MSKNTVAAVYMIIGLILMMGDAFASTKPPADWYLHMDVKALQASPLNQIIEDKKDREEINVFLNLILGQSFKNQIERVTLYGSHSGNKKYTAVLQGDFNSQSINTLINNLDTYSKSKREKVNSKTIYHYHVTDIQLDENTKKQMNSSKKHKYISGNIEIDGSVDFYLVELNHSEVVVSNDKNEVKLWTQGKYNLKGIANDGIFHVVVDLEKVLAHGGLKIGKDNINIGFESSLMQKITQLAFSIRADKKDAQIEVALETADSAVAQQLKNVVTGLIALKSLAAEEDEELQAIVKSLNVDSKGKNIIIKSTISTDELINLSAG